MSKSNYSAQEYEDRQRVRAATGTPTFKHDVDVKLGRATSTIHPSLEPKGVKVRESRDSELYPESTAVAVILDVTGSMRKVPRGVQKNLNTLMGLLLTKSFLKNPHILVGAVGDANGDLAPLQIGQFEGDIKIDESISNLYLEGGGGGGLNSVYAHESYELAMYFMAYKTSLDCFEKRGKKGYLFFVGDEMPYEVIRRSQVATCIGDELQEDIPLKTVFAKLQETYQVFFILPNMTNHWTNQVVETLWRALVGENFLRLEEPDGICELIASTIAVCEGVSLEQIADDLRSTGVDNMLATAVTNSLRTYSPQAAVGKIRIDASSPASGLTAL